MPSGRVAELAGVAALTLVITAVMAAPVLRSPSERVFGAEIVGRHHDPFTVMRRFEQPIGVTASAQPVTDISGALIERIVGPVAAYNWLVLLTFPLSAVAAYALARYLTLSRSGALVAALAYAYSPFHLAQAAYHPHIAQTQWVPLYLLALWYCLDRGSLAAATLLAAASAAVALSNSYGALIAAIITPVALTAYWLVMSRAAPRPHARLIITITVLLAIAGAGIGYASYAARAAALDPAELVFARGDLFHYSARWWSYLIPPVDHPWLGGGVRKFWEDAGVGRGLLEQQVSLGWGIVVLGLVAIAAWWGGGRREIALAPVPVMVIIAGGAMLCSLAPERTIGPFTIAGPTALFYDALPMFRSYARFGVVVQLMAALLAGMGLEQLRRAGGARARFIGAALVCLAAAEYAVSPSTLWRDVLPTAAHRWVAAQPDTMRVLDCTPPNAAFESVRWLTHHRVTPLGVAIDDCAELNLSHTLAANAYTHLLVRRDRSRPPLLAERATPAGLRMAASFGDGRVFAVTADPPTIYTAAMQGFFRRERDAEWSWRWMGANASWTIINTSATPVHATLDLEISAFHRPRLLAVTLDSRDIGAVIVDPARRIHRLGPLALDPGVHQLAFRSAEAPTLVASVIESRDRRELSFALGAWTWLIASDSP